MIRINLLVTFHLGSYTVVHAASAYTSSLKLGGTSIAFEQLAFEALRLMTGAKEASALGAVAISYL